MYSKLDLRRIEEFLMPILVSRFIVISDLCGIDELKHYAYEPYAYEHYAYEEYKYPFYILLSDPFLKAG